MLIFGLLSFTAQGAKPLSWQPSRLVNQKVARSCLKSATETGVWNSNNFFKQI